MRNITGLSNLASVLAGKRLELLREVLPGFKRLAITHWICTLQTAINHAFGSPPGIPVDRMHSAPSVLTPQPVETEAFTDATSAVSRLNEIYERNTLFLRDCFAAYVNGKPLDARVRATYPFVRITTSTHTRLDSRLSYGFVAGPGVHETSVTRPDLFRTYLTEQIDLLIENHGVPVAIGESSEPIPIHFAYRRDINIERTSPAAQGPPLTGRCATCSTRLISPLWMTRSPMARCSGRPARQSRLLYSALLVSIIRCIGSTTTLAPTRNTSKIS